MELRTGSYDALERSVLDRSADFAFVRLPMEQDGFDIMPVLETEGVRIMPPGACPVCQGRDHSRGSARHLVSAAGAPADPAPWLLKG